MIHEHGEESVHDLLSRLAPELRALVPGALLEVVFRSDTLGFAVLDAELRYRLINPALARVNQLQPESHIGLTVRDVFPNATELESILGRVLETGRPALGIEMSAASVGLSWTEGVYHIDYFPLRDETGRALGILAMLMDLTERKRAESEAKSRMTAFETLVRNIPDVVARFDRQLRHVYVNPVIERITGIPPSEFIGRTNEELGVAPDLTAFWREKLEAVFGTGQSEALEFPVDTVEGRRYFQSTLVPEPDPSGRVETVLSIARDVTDRRRAEAREQILADAGRVLATSLDEEVVLAELVRLVVPELADWSAARLLDPDGRPRVVEVVHEDPARVEQVSDLVFRTWPDPTTQVVIETGHSRLIPEITDEMLEASGLDPDHRESIRVLGIRSAMIVPLVARGRTYGVITLASAESGRRFDKDDMWLAEELGRRAAAAVENARLYAEAERARRDAEEANRAKSSFLAVMSHELRTPLNAIAGYADLLLAGVAGELNPGQVEQVQRIRQNEEQLLSLINDVLDFARVEAGRLNYVIEDVALDDALRAAESATSPLIHARRLTLERTPCPAGLTVRADPGRLRQVLLNLIGNAAKFTPAGGRITLACDAEGDIARIHVTDSGPGIPADRLEAVFAPFVQADTPLTRKHGGIGLGLAISRDLARAMNGDVTVHSVPGQGSTFTVTLPRAGSGS